MISHDRSSEIAWIMLGVLGLAFYFCFVRPRIGLHLFRDDLFLIRDSLFGRITEAGKSFDDIAYVDLRDTINGAIRLAERLHPVGFVLFYYATRHEEVGSRRPHSDDAEIQRIVDHESSEMTLRLVKYLFAEHITGWLFLAVAIVRAKLKARPGSRDVLTGSEPIERFRRKAAIEGRLLRDCIDDGARDKPHYPGLAGA